jgi:predicted esterase
VGLPVSFHEVQVPVPRTARYLTAGPPAKRASSIWYALHGYGQLARRFARHLRPFADGERLLIVPEALSRFYLEGGTGHVGASWMTREDRDSEIGDYVQYLDRVHAAVAAPADTPTLLLGFSQGVATACRWAVAGKIRPHRMVLWGGGLPADLPWPTAAKRLQRVRVTFVNGKQDANLSRTEILKQRDLLRARGVESEEIWFAGGHDLDQEVLAELASA